MTHTPGAETTRVAPWRLLLVGSMMVALYVAISWVSEESVRPVLLAGAVVLGALVGAALSLLLPSASPRARPTPARAAARAAFIGLTGVALILAQTLSASGMSWLMLGGIGLMVGAATRQWLVDRSTPDTTVR